jgi:tetratricopeptide (TPR) repeat protein
MKSAMSTVVITLAIVATCSSKSRTVRYLDHQNAGDAAFIRDDYLEAEKQYKAALAVAEEDGPDNYLVQTASHYIGINYLAQKKYPESEIAYQRQLKVAEKLYGAESPELLSPLDDITALYINWKRFDDAQRHNERALSIAARISNGEQKEAIVLAQSLRDWIKAERP